MAHHTEDTKYIFIGGLFPRDHEQEIVSNSKGSVQNAANVLQWNFINGFDKNLDEPISIINALYIGSYPKRYKKCFIKPYHFSHTPGAVDYEVGFCNLVFYKHISITKNVNRALKHILLENRDKRCVIFGYAMTPFIMNAMEFAKKHHQNVTTCLIVPDLPEYMGIGQKRNAVYTIIKKFSTKHIYTQKKYIDKYVLLTDQMHDYLNINDYTVIEGISTNTFEGVEKAEQNEKCILYAGGLNAKYGVTDLVDAFLTIKKSDYRLIICGSGNAESYIEQAAKKDPRIIFKGLIPRSEALKLQASSTVLINPRKNNEEFTKYSFPSKNLEYLSSGVPLIAYKLDGIPDEYNDYITYVPNDSLEALADTLIKVCELPLEERNALGEAAKQFALKSKSDLEQVKKVLEFVNSNDV